MVHSVLSKVFKVVEVKNPTVIMGVQIIRDRPGRQIKLHQSAFTSEILAEHGMDGWLRYFRYSHHTRHVQNTSADTHRADQQAVSRALSTAGWIPAVAHHENQI